MHEMFFHLPLIISMKKIVWCPPYNRMKKVRAKNVQEREYVLII